MREAKALYKADRAARRRSSASLAFTIRGPKPGDGEDPAGRQRPDALQALLSLDGRNWSSESDRSLGFLFRSIDTAAMRQWLVEQYGSLESINQQWGTRFASLEDVAPLTTDEMMQRGDDNWSAWADHRTFMNLTFAEAARKASDTVKSGSQCDRRPGGWQAPSAFGGYDYWLLSKAIDVIEPYNIGVNREIWRSFAPHKPRCDHRLWR